MASSSYEAENHLIQATYGWLFVSATTKRDKKVKPVLLVKVQAFAAALAKRERPVLSPTWRMCPST